MATEKDTEKDKTARRLQGQAGLQAAGEGEAAGGGLADERVALEDVAEEAAAAAAFGVEAGIEGVDEGAQGGLAGGGEDFAQEF